MSSGVIVDKLSEFGIWGAVQVHMELDCLADD